MNYFYVIPNLEQEGNFFDTAEEAWEEAVTDLIQQGYAVTGLNDSQEFTIVDKATNNSFNGIIEFVEEDLDEDINSLCDKIDSTDKELHDFMKEIQAQKINKVVNEKVI